MPVYVDPAKAALVDVDIKSAFLHEHVSESGIVVRAGGLPVRDGHKIIGIVKHRLHKIFPLQSRYACTDMHPLGHISCNESFVGFGPKSPLLLEEVRRWTATSHRIAPEAAFTFEQCREYIERVKVQILWDKHGVVGTPESQAHPDLPDDLYRYVQIKGMDPACDSYSAFLDNLGRPVGLGERIRADGFEELFITGLASDFCVKWTALNGIRDYGFRKVYVVLNATRPVDIPGNEHVAGSMAKAMDEMVDAGIRFIHADNLRGTFDPR